ncbi:hypothetical protein F5Y01DRAFT_21901 [Xylaria sp. FL0043]|nr:hypothetical protein F5Y01DRAFT_21901 [Xylaria sp. FL0043]
MCVWGLYIAFSSPVFAIWGSWRCGPLNPNKVGPDEWQLQDTKYTLLIVGSWDSGKPLNVDMVNIMSALSAETTRKRMEYSAAFAPTTSKIKLCWQSPT